MSDERVREDFEEPEEWGEEMKMKVMFFGQPSQSRKFHIFDDDKRSLCGKWSMPFHKFDDDDIVKGNEKFNDKRDCWRCFNKMIKKAETPTKKK